VEMQNHSRDILQKRTRYRRPKILPGHDRSASAGTGKTL
jgi:hypothetical protein